MRQLQLIPGLMGPHSRDLVATTLDMARHAQYALDSTDLRDLDRYNPGRIVNSCWDCYGHQVTEALLSLWTDYFSQLWNCQLVPCYSYARFHWKGAELKPHRDRTSCEYSTTVMLYGDPWPIYMAGQEYLLEPGDAITYKGAEVEHWRQPFEGDRYLIATFHWVDSQGPHRDSIYDGRPGLGMPPVG